VIFGARRLAARRLALVERSSSLRRQVAAAGAPLAARAALLDGVLAAVRSALPWATRALTIYALLKPKRRQTNSTAATISAVSAASRE
jgi:hypothetical protein